MDAAGERPAPVIRVLVIPASNNIGEIRSGERC